jgi:hypothetical protein
VGALAERLLEFRAAGEAQHLWGLSGELPVGISGQVQPAGDTATRELVVPGGGDLAGARLDPLKWRTPTAPPPPLGSQLAVSRTARAAAPARSWFRVISDRPLLTATSATLQPTGRNCTQGTRDADGTDWAISHSGSRSPQLTSLTPSGVATATSLLKRCLGFRAARTTRASLGFS